MCVDSGRSFLASPFFCNNPPLTRYLSEYDGVSRHFVCPKVGGIFVK